MKAWKDVVPVGTHISPDGVVEVTPARAVKWSKDIKAIRAAGNRIPLSWGHHPNAFPGSGENEFFKSKFNAGTIEDADFDAKRQMLRFLVDAPTCELDPDGNLVTTVELADGAKVKSAIGEVSIGTANWRDGRGKLWNDVPIHLAATPLPVWAGQDGFSPVPSVDAAAAAESGVTRRLSLSTLAYRLATTSEAKDDTVADENKTDDLDLTQVEADAESGEQDESGDGLLKRVMEALARCGIKVPDDTTTDNFLERLDVAIQAHEHTKDHQEQSEEDEVSQTEGQGQVTQEQQPVLMSTAVMAQQSPVVRALWADKEKSIRAERMARIHRLRKRGLRPQLADELERVATTVQLSLLADGSFATAAIDERIKFAEDVLDSHNMGLVSKRLATATEVANPLEAAEASGQKLSDMADAFCNRNGVPVQAGK